MRTEEEGKVIGLVHTYRRHLVDKATAMLDKERRTDAALRMSSSNGSGMVVFKQLMEGCFVTLAFHATSEKELVVMDWRFTDPDLN
jgi:hypothetical protein